MNDDIDALLYNTPTNNSLTRMSTKLLKKYKNNRSKTIMIMNRFKKRKEILSKGLEMVKVYKFTPDNKTTLSKGEDFLIKPKQGLTNFLRNKVNAKNENTYGSVWVNRKMVSPRPFTFLGQRVKGFVPVETKKDLDETHKRARFLMRALERHSDIKIKFVAITPNRGGGVFF